MKRSGIRAVWAFFLAVQLCCFSACGTQQPNPSSLQQSESDGIAVPAGPCMEEAGALGKILDFKQVCGQLPEGSAELSYCNVLCSNGRWFACILESAVKDSNRESGYRHRQTLILVSSETREVRTVAESDDAREDPFRLVCLTDRRLFWMTADETALDVMSTEIEGGEIFTSRLSCSWEQEWVHNFCASGSRAFWIAAEDGAARIMTACPEEGTSQVLYRVEDASQYYDPLFMPSGEHYFCWSADEQLFVLDADTLQQRSFELEKDFLSLYRNQQLVYGDLLLLPGLPKSGKTGELTVIDLKTGEEKKKIALASTPVTFVLCGERNLIYCDSKQLWLCDIETEADSVFAVMRNVDTRSCRLLPCGENFAVDDLQSNHQLVVFSVKNRTRRVITFPESQQEITVGDGYLYYSPAEEEDSFLVRRFIDLSA